MRGCSSPIKAFDFVVCELPNREWKRVVAPGQPPFYTSLHPFLLDNTSMYVLRMDTCSF